MPLAPLAALLTLLLPLYAWRFSPGGLPLNALLLGDAIFCAAVFALSLGRTASGPARFNKTAAGLGALLVAAAGTASFFINHGSRAGLGQLMVLALEPAATYFAIRAAVSREPRTEAWVRAALYLLVGSAGALALVQYFTLHGLDPMFWGNALEPKRATAFFAHPNFYALLAAPSLAYLLPDAARIFTEQKNKFRIASAAAWLLGAAGLLLSLSRAGWLGLGAAVIVYGIAAGNRNTKRAVGAAIIAVAVVVAAVPNLRWRVLLPFYGERSASSRTELWAAGGRAVSASPIFGLGPGGFGEQFNRYAPGFPEHHNHPHNVVLGVWLELGLLGLLGFLLACAAGLAGAWRLRRTSLPALGAGLAVVVVLSQGMLDGAYVKNDLALLFWMLLALGGA